MGRARLRDLGITIGRLPTGPRNAITDVPGVLVGHRTLVADAPRVARTGVTMVIPRNGAIWTNYAFAGVVWFNGHGEMTGSPLVAGSGMRCHGFKGGMGTASRVVEGESGRYTVGVLVQANYGQMIHLRVNGVQVGRALAASEAPREPKGSIIIVIGTDAPLLPIQCTRL